MQRVFSFPLFPTKDNWGTGSNFVQMLNIKFKTFIMIQFKFKPFKKGG